MKQFPKYISERKPWNQRITNWEDAAVENWKYISAMASPDDLR